MGCPTGISHDHDPEGEILHAETADAPLVPSALLLADMGVESPMGYASDITRTFPVGGRFTPEQRDVYTVVLEAQRAAIRRMAPGVAFRDVHLTAARVIAHGLRDMGVLRGDPDRAVSEGAHTLFSPTGSVISWASMFTIWRASERIVWAMTMRYYGIDVSVFQPSDSAVVFNPDSF